MQRWPVAHVEALAPDEQILKAGHKLAVPQPWLDVGCSDTVLWGRCQGSGKTPYQVSIDLSGPSYHCSCPSRKFPCKHAMALLMLWSQGHMNESGIADFAAQWSDKKHSKPKQKIRNRTPAELAASAEETTRRIAQREERIDKGFADLECWLADQIEQGLATSAADRPALLAKQAARMVDAQAPGVASLLLRAATIGENGPDWPARTLHDFGLIYLLTQAWANRATLDEPALATVRQHIGFTVPTETVLAVEPVKDSWIVIGLRDADEERVSVRRVWLWGRNSQRFALAMFFAVGGSAFDTILYPGIELSAAMHFYPGRVSLRAVLGEHDADTTTYIAPLEVQTFDSRIAQDCWRDALAQDPWLSELPIYVSGQFGIADDWVFITVTGNLPLIGGSHDVRSLILQVGDSHVVAFGELSDEGFRCLAAILAGQVILP